MDHPLQRIFDALSNCQLSNVAFAKIHRHSHQTFREPAYISTIPYTKAEWHLPVTSFASERSVCLDLRHCSAAAISLGLIAVSFEEGQR